MDFGTLLTELQNKSDLKKDEIITLVDRKYSEMKDLITKEGAVYLVGKDLEINLTENINGRMPIKNIVAGMRNVNIVGRIFRISKINEFTKSNGATGRVANIFIGDNTGFIRIPLWDDQVKLLEVNVLSVGYAVYVSNGMVRENVFGNIEITLGRFGTITQVEDFVELPSVEDLIKIFLSSSSERTSISDIVSGGNFEVKGTVLQLFKGNFLFDICPMCGNKPENKKCIEHGDITPNHALVLSFILDDGTDNLRCVLFRDIAEKICNVSAEDLSKLNADVRYNTLSAKLLGKEIVLIGRIKKNDMLDRLEMIVNDFKGINPLEESKKLVDGIELMVN